MGFIDKLELYEKATKALITQEVFHVYLKKIEIGLPPLFFTIFI